MTKCNGLAKRQSGQTKSQSFLESCIQISIGFFVSLITWIFIVCPLFGIEMGFLDNLGITAIFTVTSLIRQYVIRRWFNRRI